MHHNAILFVSLLVSRGIIPRSCLSATSTRNSYYNLYLPYVSSSLYKRSTVYQSIALWNALPVELQQLSSFKSFKHQCFRILLLRYCNKDLSLFL